MTKLLSICIPTFNRKEKLKAQIAFFEKEGVCSIDEVEVIVSDNASLDGTFNEFLYNKSNKNFYFYKQDKNIGIINNIHSAITHASGKYTWIVGDDDILTSGILEKVLKILKNHPNVGYVFINHKYINGNDIDENPVYKGIGGFYNQGLTEFFDMASTSGFGPGIFLSANIYLTANIKKADSILEKFGEYENMTLPLAYTLFCAKDASYFIKEPLVLDQVEGISWSESTTLVFCRDIIAAINSIGNGINMGDYFRKFLIKHLPSHYPEFKYEKVKNKFKKNNYALMFFRKYYPCHLLFDTITYPFYLILRFWVKRLGII